MKLEAKNRLVASYHADERGTYSSAVPDTKTRNDLYDLIRRFVVNSGEPTGIWDLHTTLVWSKAAISPEHQYTLSREYGCDSEFIAEAKEATIWNGHDNEYYLVLLLESEDLVRANTRLLTLGLPPANFDYQPHVTLAKRVAPDMNIADLNMAIRFLKPLRFLGMRLEDAKN